MKNLYSFLAISICFIIASCNNNMDEIAEESDLKALSIEPKFTGNIPHAKAVRLMNKFLDAPTFFYFDEVLGYNPNVAISTGRFSVGRNGRSISVRSIDIGVIGKKGRYGVYGKPVTSKDVYSILPNGTKIHGTPIYDESNNHKYNPPIAVRYEYTTNGAYSRQNCWVVIAWDSYEYFEELVFGRPPM